MRRTCLFCQEQFEIEKAQLKYPGYGQFCSRRCHYKSRGMKPHAEIATPEGRVLVYAPGSAMANHQGYAYRYRLIMARHIGRDLAETECVHHINGDCSDDRFENLVLHSASSHTFEHALRRARLNGYDLLTQKRCRNCGAVKERSRFSPSTNRGRKTLNSLCKPCAAKWQRDRRGKNNGNATGDNTGGD